MGCLASLPEWSSGPRGDLRRIYSAIKEAQYQGVQGGDIALCRELGLGVTGGGRVNKVGEIEPLAKQWQDEGLECATLHVGWGMEDDDEVLRLVEDVLQASEKTSLPLYIETHRATITQDIWRTVQMVQKLPDVRFNGDFSHWYTGLEMVYGDFDDKFRFIEPVLDRVRFFHGRIGNPGSMQVSVNLEQQQPYVDHFRKLWTRSFVGFLKSARPGDYICFAPELLHPEIYYARVFPGSDGRLREESDRWEQALVLTRIAKECFAAAEQIQIH
jgi:hypothetical protein